MEGLRVPTRVARVTWKTMKIDKNSAAAMTERLETDCCGQQTVPHEAGQMRFGEKRISLPLPCGVEERKGNPLQEMSVSTVGWQTTRVATMFRAIQDTSAKRVFQGKENSPRARDTFWGATSATTATKLLLADNQCHIKESCLQQASDLLQNRAFCCDEVPMLQDVAECCKKDYAYYPMRQYVALVANVAKKNRSDYSICFLSAKNNHLSPDRWLFWQDEVLLMLRFMAYKIIIRRVSQAV